MKRSGKRWANDEQKMKEKMGRVPRKCKTLKKHDFMVKKIHSKFCPKPEVRVKRKL